MTDFGRLELAFPRHINLWSPYGLQRIFAGVWWCWGVSDFLQLQRKIIFVLISLQFLLPALRRAYKYREQNQRGHLKYGGGWAEEDFSKRNRKVIMFCICRKWWPELQQPLATLRDDAAHMPRNLSPLEHHWTVDALTTTSPSWWDLLFCKIIKAFVFLDIWNLFFPYLQPLQPTVTFGIDTPRVAQELQQPGPCRA